MLCCAGVSHTVHAHACMSVSLAACTILARATCAYLDVGAGVGVDVGAGVGVDVGAGVGVEAVQLFLQCVRATIRGLAVVVQSAHRPSSVLKRGHSRSNSMSEEPAHTFTFDRM